MDASRMSAVAELWRVHRKAPFPARLTSVDVAGVEMVMLDADIAGCVSSWLDNGGTLDDRRRSVLAFRRPQLEQVLPELSGEEKAYYQRLHEMSAPLQDPSGVSAPE